MTHDSLQLLVYGAILGSFLPNNLGVWVIRRLFLRRKAPGPAMNPMARWYHKFESDPKTQYSYHRKMQKFWLINFIPMFALISVDIWYSLKNGINVQALITAALLALNTIYSLYANFDTETGDAHAAYASLRADEIKNGDSTDQQLVVATDVLAGQFIADPELD